MDLYMSYAATETYATLAALVGTTTNVKVSNTVAGLSTPSATEPCFTLTGCYLETLPVISASMGELSTISDHFSLVAYSPPQLPDITTTAKARHATKD
jgi:hypothetical protein